MYGLIYRFIHLYTPQFINKEKPRVGIEPTTTRLRVTRSTRLSHRGIFNCINPNQLKFIHQIKKYME